MSWGRHECVGSCGFWGNSALQTRNPIGPCADYARHRMEETWYGVEFRTFFSFMTPRKLNSIWKFLLSRYDRARTTIAMALLLLSPLGLCAPCFIKIHSRGSMTQHVRVLRDTVKDEAANSSALLNSLPGHLPHDSPLISANNAPLPMAPSPIATSTPLTPPATLVLPVSSASSPTSQVSMFCGGTTRTCPPAPARMNEDDKEAPVPITGKTVWMCNGPIA